MIRKLAVTSILILVAANVLGNPQQRKERWNEVTSVEGLPFCVFILSNVYNRAERLRTVDILMEPRRVDETNLSLLFKILSEKFPEDATLKVWVNTDVTQLSMLATGRGGSGPFERKRAPQLALYLRTQSVELFRYNPNYPQPGEKTIIIRGKED